MPIFNPNSGTAPEAPKKETVIEPEVSVSQVYETQQSKTPLITEIEGEPWVVNYYHQMLVEGESPKTYDPGVDPTLQQYAKVVDFRLSVTDGLSFTQNGENQTSELTGDALVYPDTVAPHVGDMFVAYIEAGRQGVFTIASVEALGYYKRTAYRVTYRLFAEASPTTQVGLDEKVVQHRYFDVRRLKAGFSPLIAFEVANTERMYYKELRRLMDRLYLRYYDPRIKTFLVDILGEQHYDPWVVGFFNAIVPHTVRGSYPAPTEYSVGQDIEVLDKPTLWAAILKRDEFIVKTMPRTYALKASHEITPPSMYRSVANAGVDMVYIPEQWDNPIVDREQPPYLMTHAFYDEADTMSSLEAGVWDIIRGTGISNTVLSGEVESVMEEDGIFGLRKLVLLIAILRMKLGGV